jgi:hypothetical protein
MADVEVVDMGGDDHGKFIPSFFQHISNKSKMFFTLVQSQKQFQNANGKQTYPCKSSIQ